MQKEQMDHILAEIAKKHNTTPDCVRREMEIALNVAQNSNNPYTKAKWALIPRKGDSVTLEEFLDYMVNTIHKLTPP